jgi:hypothetical protein
MVPWERNISKNRAQSQLEIRKHSYGREIPLK